MGLGVLADHHLEHVPGTSLLSDKGSLAGVDTEAYRGIDSKLLKHDRTGRVVLVPQVTPASKKANNLALRFPE